MELIKMQINIVQKTKYGFKFFLNEKEIKGLKTITIIKMFVLGLFNKKKDIFEISFYDKKLKQEVILIQMVF